MSWSLIDTQIHACLLIVISPQIQKYARGFATYGALWNALATRFNSLSTAHIFQLRDRLHTLRKGTRTMVQYLDEAASIISDLDALNEVVPKRDVINAVVRGLPAEFSSLKQHIRYHDGPLTSIKYRAG